MMQKTATDQIRNQKKTEGGKNEVQNREKRGGDVGRLRINNPQEGNKAE
jgi:hypothetical protein